MSSVPLSPEERTAVYDYTVTEGWTLEKLKTRAEECLHELGQSELFQNCAGGILGHFVKVDHPEWSEEQRQAVGRALGIDERWVPETAILRDVMPLMILLRNLLLPLTRGNIARREELLQSAGRLVREYETSTDAALETIDLEKLREMAKKWG